MPIAIITFNDPINSSLQEGDIVYYSPTNQAPNSNINKAINSAIVKLGVVSSIMVDPPRVNVIYEDDPGNTGSATVFPPSIDDYVMFEKDKRVNSSSLVGYYANVRLLNDSKKKVELFSLSSEVSESSK
tara:strand:+ start:61 stop:447 length:387 start_codon:yes stop_codon:yes gene_type:complete